MGGEYGIYGSAMGNGRPDPRFCLKMGGEYGIYGSEMGNGRPDPRVLSATRTTPGYKVSPTSGQTYFNAVEIGAKAMSITNGSDILQWLNAYNAPHWTMLSGVTGWANNQTNTPTSTAIENYGSSWMRDLMTAKGLVTVAGLTQGNTSFRGATDANHGYTPFGHASHDLGMAMDLGISTHITDQGYRNNVASAAIEQVSAGSVPGTWSNNLAAEYVRQMISDPGRRQDLAFSDFALLYAATISGNNGARDSLATSIRGSTDTTAVLSALFGNGTQTGSIVNGVIIGGTAGKKDTYPDVRYALNHLGFRMVANPALNTLPSVSNGGPHYHHFHIYFQAPTRRDLPKLLVAETSSNFVMPTVAENLALAVSKPISAAVIRGVEKESLGVCNEVENPTSTKRIGLSNTGGLLNPGGLIARPLKFRYGIEPLGIISTTITKNPAHGSVMAGDWSRATQDAPQATYQYFKYVPNPGFIGKDSIGFEITVNGKTFRASLRINVLETWDNGDSCNPPGEDRGDLSDAPSYAWVLDGLSEILPVQAGTPEQRLQSAALSALIANASRNQGSGLPSCINKQS